MKQNKTLKLTTEELEKVFPKELLAIVEPDDFTFIVMFKLRAITDGVTSEELTQVADVIKRYAA